MFRTLRKALREELESNDHRIGQGWISGASSLVLSLAAFLLVVGSRFPGLFTSVQLRKLEAMPGFDHVLQGALLIAFLLACTSMVLRQNKLLGLTSAFLIITATFFGSFAFKSAGGGGVHTVLALDWFVLNLAITGALFLPLERLFRRTPMPIFRFEWRSDILYFAISSMMVQPLTYLTTLPASVVLAHGHLSALRAWTVGLPWPVQLAAVMFLTDFFQYWLHRAFHKVPFLWKFHAVHHSAQSMDWLAGSRMHVVEIVCLRSFTIIPMYTLGFANTVIYAYIAIVYVYATYLHANLRFDVEGLKGFIATPRFHHWHHGIEKEAIDVNFSIHFPVLDRIFGTYHMPGKAWPSAYGVGGHPVPEGYLKQLAYPFTPNPAPAETT